jgi:hypothetical protein
MQLAFMVWFTPELRRVHLDDGVSIYFPVPTQTVSEYAVTRFLHLSPDSIDPLPSALSRRNLKPAKLFKSATYIGSDLTVRLLDFAPRQRIVSPLIPVSMNGCCLTGISDFFVSTVFVRISEGAA